MTVIRGVLLDVGDTLTTPKGGRWNPRFDFEDNLAARGLTFRPEALTSAFGAGHDYLYREAAKSNRNDYHRVILDALGIEATDELLATLDSPLPFSRVIDVFPDVVPALSTMTEWGLRLAIVADTGITARQLYQELGWTDLFDEFAISAELGCCKPDPLMYRTASDGLGLSPAECLFVDNDPINVRGALALGYRACGISRYHEPPDDGLTWTTDMDGVLQLLRTQTEM